MLDVRSMSSCGLKSIRMAGVWDHTLSFFVVWRALVAECSCCSMPTCFTNPHVQREDGTNVNQWHWKEKDCMTWSRSRLGELFSNLTLVSGSSSVHTTGIKAVEGKWCELFPFHCTYQG